MCKALRRWRQFGKARAYRIAHRFAIAECVWERLQDAARDARETTVGQACRCVLFMDQQRPTTEPRSQATGARRETAETEYRRRQLGRAACRERVGQYG